MLMKFFAASIPAMAEGTHHEKIFAFICNPRCDGGVFLRLNNSSLSGAIGFRGATSSATA
jgi:hypothetical protein